MSTDTLTHPTVLAFERKLDPSDAIFFEGCWGERHNSAAWRPIMVREKSVRGTISNYQEPKDQDPAKLNKSLENPNPQFVDVASLSPNADTLKVKFTLRVLAGSGQPSACNKAKYQEKLLATVNHYINEYGFTELARRYAQNLANGRFLWRNRMGAEQVEVHVAQMIDGKEQAQWVFDAFALSLRSFDESKDSAQSVNLGQLSSLIADGLAGKQHVLLQVTAFVRAGAGQEVFPSQEMILKREKGDKSKTLYSVDGIAGMHSQKIGNALRSIDTWYEGADSNGPIAIEPYGAVTTQGKAYRQPKQSQDFFSLLENWVEKDKTLHIEQQHFIMANLIRGGVFSKPESKKKSDKG